MVIDTLFLCFCQDYSQNDGSPGKEYFAPPSLLVNMINAIKLISNYIIIKGIFN